MLSAGFAASPFLAIMEADRTPAPTDENSRDIQLMERIGAGDHRAFRELVERHQNAIVGTVAKMLGNPSEAEDIAQQVFIRVWKSASRYEPTAKFTTWLFKITRNLVFNELRRRKPHPAHSLDVVNEDDRPERAPDPGTKGPPVTRRVPSSPETQACANCRHNTACPVQTRTLAGEGNR